MEGRKNRRTSILAFRAQADLGFHISFDTPKRHKTQMKARNSRGFDRKNYNSEVNRFTGSMSPSLKHFLK